MKIYIQYIKGCYECPKAQDYQGVWICGFTDGSSISIKNNKPVPEWCPLPNKVN